MAGLKQRSFSIRAITLAVFISIFTSAAMAQNAQTLPPAGPDRLLAVGGVASAVPEAPIGHRQPTERDLPPSVRRDENTALPGPLEPLGVPKICQGC